MYHVLFIAMLNAIMPSVVMLNVVLSSVVAPFGKDEGRVRVEETENEGEKFMERYVDGRKEENQGKRAKERRKSGI